MVVLSEVLLYRLRAFGGIPVSVGLLPKQPRLRAYGPDAFLHPSILL